MQNRNNSESGLSGPRILVAVALCSVASLLAVFSFASTPSSWNA